MTTFSDEFVSQQPNRALVWVLENVRHKLAEDLASESPDGRPPRVSDRMVSKAIGLHFTTVSGWRHGTIKTADYDTIVRCAEILEIPPEQLWKKIYVDPDHHIRMPWEDKR